jgi:hypothetical protein
LPYDDYLDAWKCGENGKKILLVHLPPGNPENAQEICIDYNALASHLSNHGDFVGAYTSCISSTSSKAKLPYEDTSISNDFEMTLSPNPTNELVNLNLVGISGQSKIIVSNVLGIELWSKELDIKQSVLEINLPNSIYKYGVYFITIASNGKVITKQLIIKE